MDKGHSALAMQHSSEKGLIESAMLMQHAPSYCYPALTGRSAVPLDRSCITYVTNAMCMPNAAVQACIADVYKKLPSSLL